MLPLGDYKRLIADVKERYDGTETVTFGILIADYDKYCVRQNIINYLEIFNNHSKRYIDFYIPGYANWGGDEITPFIDVYGNKYYFRRELFTEFLLDFEKSFGYKCDYKPALILVELNNLDFLRCKKMVIGLGDCENAGILFDEIFGIARKYVDLKHFQMGIKSTLIKGTLSDTLIRMTNNNIIIELKSLSDNLRNFKIL